MAWGVFLKRTTRRDRGRQASGDSLEQSKADAVEQQHQYSSIATHTKQHQVPVTDPTNSGSQWHCDSAQVKNTDWLCWSEAIDYENDLRAISPLIPPSVIWLLTILTTIKHFSADSEYDGQGHCLWRKRRPGDCDRGCIQGLNKYILQFFADGKFFPC